MPHPGDLLDAQGGRLIGIAVALVLVGGPLLLGLSGIFRARRTPAEAVREPGRTWNWKLTINSALLYALAFNLTFFIQELFLVLPKALIGLRPTLFHNNHTWEGENPLASLFQGTGALAIFLTGVTCAQFLRGGPGRSTTVRLFLIWMTYNGFFQSLPQVVIGALNPQNDVGMAMEYLGLDATAKTAAALVALAAIPPTALWLRRPLLSLAEDPGCIATARARTRLVFQVATVPALTAIVLIIPFRVPREWIEVVILPVVVTVIGIAWLQAGAWRVSGFRTDGGLGAGSIAYPLGALLLLLLVFQLLLRPGVRFYYVKLVSHHCGSRYHQRPAAGSGAAAVITRAMSPGILNPF
jgi:hypothetical protein